MGRLSKNFVLIFITMYFGGIAGDEGNGSIINLEYFRHPHFFNMGNSGEFCEKSCEDMSTGIVNIEKDPKMRSSCYGKIRECQSIHVPGTGKLKYCSTNDASSELLWVLDPIRNVTYGKKEDCAGKGTEKEETLWYIGGKQCPICVCTCYEAESPMISNKGKWWFSTIPQTCEENKVITAIRFTEVNHTIFLQIKQHQFPFEGEGTWKDLEQEVEAEEGVHLDTKVLLTDKLKSILLDEIVIPNDHVITGVRFEQTVIPGTSTPAIQLSARITKLNSDRNGLESDSQRWEVGGTSKLKSTSVKWLPSSRTIAPHSVPYVSFGIGSLMTDFGKSSEPTISADPTEILFAKETPLVGIQLLLVNITEKQQILARVAPLGIEPSEESKETEDDSDETYDPDGANTINLQFILIAIVPVLIISNLFD